MSIRDIYKAAFDAAGAGDEWERVVAEARRRRLEAAATIFGSQRSLDAAVGWLRDAVECDNTETTFRFAVGRNCYRLTLARDRDEHQD